MLRKAFILLLWSAFALAQNPVRITQGPAVEHTDATTATIAWSTDTNAGTLVKYGTDPNNLSQQAAMPWGGFTHRVTLKNLKPNTTYYFQAISGQAQGSGTTASSDIAQLQTADQAATSAPATSAPNQQSPPANPPN